MKRFTTIKKLQIVMLVAVIAVTAALILRDYDFYTLIGSDRTAKALCTVLGITLAGALIFLIYDFNAYADLQRENEALDTALHSDALTGIANRYSVDAFLGQFRGRDLPADLGVITLDFTNLMEINKTHGYSRGDQAIQEFAAIMQKASDGKCFIGRNGGTKFVAVFRECTDSKIRRFMSSMESLTAEHNAAQPDLPLRYSAGTAFNEGKLVGSVTELVALSDIRAAQAANRTTNLS